MNSFFVFYSDRKQYLKDRFNKDKFSLNKKFSSLSDSIKQEKIGIHSKSFESMFFNINSANISQVQPDILIFEDDYIHVIEYIKIYALNSLDPTCVVVCTDQLAFFRFVGTLVDSSSIKMVIMDYQGFEDEQQNVTNVFLKQRLFFLKKNLVHRYRLYGVSQFHNIESKEICELSSEIAVRDNGIAFNKALLFSNPRMMLDLYEQAKTYYSVEPINTTSFNSRQIEKGKLFLKKLNNTIASFYKIYENQELKKAEDLFCPEINVPQFKDPEKNCNNAGSLNSIFTRNMELLNEVRSDMIFRSTIPSLEKAINNGFTQKNRKAYFKKY